MMDVLQQYNISERYGGPRLFDMNNLNWKVVPLWNANQDPSKSLYFLLAFWIVRIVAFALNFPKLFFLPPSVFGFRFF